MDHDVGQRGAAQVRDLDVPDCLRARAQHRVTCGLTHVEQRFADLVAQRVCVERLRQDVVRQVVRAVRDRGDVAPRVGERDARVERGSRPQEDLDRVLRLDPAADLRAA